MGTYTGNVQELLLLFKCVTETGTDVITFFAEKKLLRRYNGNFERFLDDKKHEIFHLWQCDKLSCCACPPTGCDFKRFGLMGDWIFKKIYSEYGLEDRGHLIQSNGRVVDVCLHKYITRTIAIHELDLSAISFILRNCARLSPNEIDALVMITKYRREICQAYMMNIFTYDFYIRAWTDLERSLVYLTDPSYKGVIRKEIQYLHSVNLEREEITELLKNFAEVNIVHALQELHPSKDNIGALGGRLQHAAISYAKHVTPYIAARKCTFSVNQTQQAILKEANIMREDKQGKLLRPIQNCKRSLKSERPFNVLIQKKTKDKTYPGLFLCDGLFIDCIVDSRLEKKPKDLKSMYLNNNFVDYRSIGTHFDLQVAAVGAVSRVQNIRHKINLVDKKQIEYETLAQSVNKRAVHFPQPLNINDCNHFVSCVLNDVGKEELINPRTVTFHQQISMRNVSFRQGDSGMCVYVKWPGVEYQCLGMAIASHPDGGCIITPIKAILSAFKLI